MMSPAWSFTAMVRGSKPLYAESAAAMALLSGRLTARVVESPTNPGPGPSRWAPGR